MRCSVMTLSWCSPGAGSSQAARWRTCEARIGGRMSEPGAQLDLNPVLDELIDWRFKSFPALAEPVPIRSVPSQAWNVLAGDFVLPSLVLKERPLQHNIQLMAQYCRDPALSLAPHPKTPAA